MDWSNLFAQQVVVMLICFSFGDWAVQSQLTPWKNIQIDQRLSLQFSICGELVVDLRLDIFNLLGLRGMGWDLFLGFRLLLFLFQLF